MKKSFYVMTLISIALMYFFTPSCNKTPTYGEMKDAEKKIIRKILDEKQITVLTEYPANGVFAENEFVLLKSGIYLHVVDSGNGNRAVYDGYNSTDVLARMSGSYYYTKNKDTTINNKDKKIKRDTVVHFNTFYNSNPPFEFKYGFANSVASDHEYIADAYYYFFSMGLESILEFVGDSAEVKLIVPGHAEIGSYSAASKFQTSGMNYTFIPIYYDRVRYIFW